MPRTDKYPFRADLRAKLIEVASRDETIEYLELGAGRAMIGRYLYRIAREEAAAKRPPLTSVVIRKGAGLPGDGFRLVQNEIDCAWLSPDLTERNRARRLSGESPA